MFEIKHTKTKLLFEKYRKKFSKKLKIKNINIIENNRKTGLPV